MDTSLGSALSTAALLAIFVILWLYTTSRLDDMCGWTALAQVYRHEGHFNGKRSWLQGGRMRGISMIFWIVGANAEGIYLMQLWVFAPRAPALFIPWTDVTVRAGRDWFFFRCIDLTFRQVPTAPLRIIPLLARRLASAAGPAWPGEPVETR